MVIVQYVFQPDHRGYPSLRPGGSLPIPLNFTEAGIALLFISADVSSSRPVKLAIYNAQGQEVWATRPSTQIVDDIVVLETPGSYELRIENPSSAKVLLTASIKVFMYGSPAIEFWLRQYIKSAIKDAALNGVKTKTAPMGIASYGVMEVDGQYFAYTLTTDAVKGVVYIPPDTSASGYGPEGTYHGQAFSVQLNAFVVARLKDEFVVARLKDEFVVARLKDEFVVARLKDEFVVARLKDEFVVARLKDEFVVARLKDETVQYYWIQNVVGFDEKHKELKVENNIWNATTEPSILGDTVKGKCEVYRRSGRGEFYHCYMPDSIPFGRVELETRTRVDDGKIIVEFYANGQEYDEVTITPDPPAASARIVIAPAITPTSLPLDLELVLAGRDDTIPFTILDAGRIGLELYVREEGKWVPPPSAWSIGRVTYERSHARVEPQGVGSALVMPGEPNLQQLWSNPIKMPMPIIKLDDPKILIAIALVIFLVLDKILDGQQRCDIYKQIAFAMILDRLYDIMLKVYKSNGQNGDVLAQIPKKSLRAL